MVPHSISDHDTDLVQLNIWTGTKWVNIFDGNDFKNMSIDLHRVAKVVEDQVLEINKAVKDANAAMDQANKAVDSSNVNKTAIDSANKAIDEAKSSANDALDKIKSLASNDAVDKIKSALEDSIQNINDSIEKTTVDVTKIKQSQADQIKDVTGQINDAVAQAKAAADSLNARTNDLQIAIKNAQGDATVAKQTANQANLTAIDAKSDAAVATATAKQVTINMKNAESDVLAAKATANEATITAGNAASDAATAKITASGAAVTATNAKNDVAKVSATVDDISTNVTSIDKKVTDLGSEVTQNQTAIAQNKNAIALKADQSTVDGINNKVVQNEARLSVQAKQIDSKVSETKFDQLNAKMQNIGSRNLLHDTSGQNKTLTADSNGVLNKTTASDSLTSVADYHGGDPFTYAATITNTSQTPVKLRIQLCDNNSNVLTGQNSVIDSVSVAPGTWNQRVSVTAPIRDDTWKIRTYVVFDGKADPGSQVKVKDERLIAGNSASTWAPNPADLVKRIDSSDTEINQTKQLISLKADKTTVDNISNQVSQNYAQLKVQAGQISSKAESTELKKVSDKADSAIAGNAKAESDAQAASSKADTAIANDAATSAKVDKVSDKADSAVAATVKNATAIDQNSKLLALKADQTSVDKLNKTVTDNSAAVKILSGEMMSKVDSTTVNKLIDDKGFATTEQAQALIDQTANKISGTITDLKTTVDKNGNLISTTADRLTNVTQTVDGLQTAVKSKADQSQITQLSNQLTAKVSTKDYQTEIAALEKNLNLRVQKGDVISQINLEAGGPGLIQVENGKGKLLLDADAVVFKSKAFIPSAAIIDIAADKITSGTLDAGNIRVINLTADNIHGGTLDVGDMNIKNLKADDITTGTLTGVVVKSDNKQGQSFALDNATMTWYNSKNAALIGRGIDYYNGIDYDYDDSKFSILSNNGIFISNNLIIDSTGKIETKPLTAFIEIKPSRSTVVPNDVTNDHDLMIATDDGASMRMFDAKELYGDRSSVDYTTLRFTSLHNVEFDLGYSVNDDPTGNNQYLGKSAFKIQKDNKVGAYFGQGDNGDEINITAIGGTTHYTNLTVDAALQVTGRKNAIVNTTQGYIAINAYETAEYYFGDIGESQTGADGQVTIGIDKVFNETVNTTISYQVFITPYSDCHVWVDQRYDNRFIVRSDQPNARFGWELKAKRKGYEGDRLIHVDK